MFKQSPERLVGNEAFEGYGVELIQGLSELLSKIMLKVNPILDVIFT